jgi:hypothetical protein
LTSDWQKYTKKNIKSNKNLYNILQLIMAGFSRKGVGVGSQCGERLFGGNQ